jgi:four helix bundle protein
MMHPPYKDHPLWQSAMSLTRDAYALAERLRGEAPELARRLRKAAVSIPAHVAGALSAEPGSQREDVLAARGALAELSRQASRAQGKDSRDVARRAEELDRIVLFELAETGPAP